MADNTFQFGITVDTSTVASNLSEIQSQFQQTTSSVASQWTEASSTVTVSLTKMADAAEESAGRTKEQIEKAQGAIGLLSDMIGIKVPDALQKMLASSELVGPALEAAFAPLAIISLIQVIGDAIKKVGDLTNSWHVLSEAERAAISAKVNEEKKAEESANRVKEIQRETQLVGKTTVEQARLRAEWAEEDAKKLTASLGPLRQRLAMDKQALELAGKFRIEGQTDELPGRVVPLLSEDEIKNAEADLADLVAHYGKDLQDLEHENQESAEKQKLAQAQAAEASLQTAKASAQARAEAASAASQRYIQGLHDELTVLRQNHLVGIEEELHFWQSKLASARNYPAAYRAIMDRIADIDQTVFKEAQEKSARFTAEAMADAKRANDEIIKANKEQLDIAAAGYKGDIEEAKLNEQTKVQLAQESLAKGRITKQQEIAMIAAAKQEEIAEEIKAWQAIEFIYDQEPKKVAEIENKIRQLRAQARLEDARAANQAARANESRWQKQLQDWQNINKQMQDSYLQMLNSMNSALVSFVTTGKLNWQQMANAMISDILKIALQWVESQIMMKLLGTQAGADTARSNVMSSAASGAAAAGASVAAIPVVGWSMVEAVSMATYSMLSAYQAGIKQLDVGTWNVPAAMPAYLHPGEIVMPAFESNLFRNMAKDMSQGGRPSLNSAAPVHMHFHINAIDGADAASFIQKNARNITSVLYKQMRKKGFQLG
jgi:Lambda phage tail tape-measure protein (Tape_meas_lam_C)